MRRYKYLSVPVHHLESSLLKPSVSCESFNGISFCMRRSNKSGIHNTCYSCWAPKSKGNRDLVAIAFYVFKIPISPRQFVITLQFWQAVIQEKALRETNEEIKFAFTGDTMEFCTRRYFFKRRQEKVKTVIGYRWTLPANTSVWEALLEKTEATAG